jgi:DNA processing protein
MLVVQVYQVEDHRVQDVDVHAVLDGLCPQVVGGNVDETSLFFSSPRSMSPFIRLAFGSLQGQDWLRYNERDSPFQQPGRAMTSQTSASHDLLGPLNEVERKHAPEVLLTAGDTRLLEEGARVSIVGCPEASAEGIRRASQFATLLAERSIVLVSGLAEGIDTAAHTAAITGGGRTIAVIATPLDQVYPKQNAALQHRIAQGHLLISQFPPGSPFRRRNFLLRSRTMALISDATVIIEAREVSESVQQGWEALRLGRPLFIEESVADDPSRTWPGAMLGYGARILSDETLDEFFDSLPPRLPVRVNGELPF